MWSVKPHWEILEKVRREYIIVPLNINALIYSWKIRIHDLMSGTSRINRQFKQDFDCNLLQLFKIETTSFLSMVSSASFNSLIVMSGCDVLRKSKSWTVGLQDDQRWPYTLVGTPRTSAKCLQLLTPVSSLSKHFKSSNKVILFVIAISGESV